MQRLWSWYWTKSRRDQLLEIIDQARLFEEWQAAAMQLDKCMDYDIWYVCPFSLQLQP
jgi:TAG lipase/lysophosphatidylethanolamine acyltransferase